MTQKYLFSFLLFWLCFVSYAQDNKTKADSTAIGYKKIENYSKKNKFTKFVHKLVFRSTNVKPKQPNKIQSIAKKHAVYENKIIRNITIKTLDPFGYSEIDSTKKPKRFTEKAGNTIHMKSRNFAIKNILLLKKNKPYDSLIVQETERLIRSQRFVRRVAINSELVGKNTDSVDVTITVLDSWSLIPNATITPSKATYELTERNFLGSGHLWDNRYQHELDEKRRAFSTRYVIPNIKNTYIQTDLIYQIDLESNYSKSMRVERSFFSPFTRWAGGFFMENRLRRDSLPNIASNYSLQTFKYNTFDLWVGHSFRIRSDEFNDRKNTNLVTTLRYYKVNYLEDISPEFDAIDFFTNESFWLTGIGLSSRNFVQDEYVFNFAIAEDIPIGKYYGITAGVQQKNNEERLYIGAKATLGNYFKWGYLSTNYEYGSFFRGRKNQQTALALQLNYFTPLIELGKWKIRQFIKNDFIIGSHRLESVGDRISINESNGINGFNDPKFLGTSKVLVSFQTQSYSPWQWAGFRFSPFINYSLAFLSDSSLNFVKSNGYSKLGLGLIITNDYLVFNSFQISFAYYPRIPNQGENIFKSNTFKTSDFGYLDFEINKPKTVLYE
ncbi:hypothetical protein [Flavobacterium lacus]|uniref:Outer membrane protein assembly factor BamA n=1 Tax=Flavobacterium lacus TaxID=1353778 RepID=A0A328WL91_9FLAO|nr:hypothetical protein [Flavobacterium lacus]RAR46963.1 hypothetical protein B0I10_11379 [Flavobacterium lacus]